MRQTAILLIQLSILNNRAAKWRNNKCGRGCRRGQVGGWTRTKDHLPEAVTFPRNLCKNPLAAPFGSVRLGFIWFEWRCGKASTRKHFISICSEHQSVIESLCPHLDFHIPPLFFFSFCQWGKSFLQLKLHFLISL